MAHLKLKSKTIVSVSIIFFFFFSFLSTAIADDAAYMSKLLTALTPTPPGWSHNTHFCEWSGVFCVRSNSVLVVGLIDLPSMSLSGTLPSDLNSLSQLTSLSLQDNSLSGPLPSLANLTMLQSVYLDHNNFTSIPNGCFQGLTSLVTLSLSNNTNLAPWTFPTDLIQSSVLDTLGLEATNIMGSLPDIFDSFPSLQSVRLSYNNITGGLPMSFGRSGIVTLRLDNQNYRFGLSGTIEVLSSMTFLSQAWLQYNRFTGQIPDLSNCNYLFDLQLENNRLTGVVPPSLMGLSSLQNVSLGMNWLQGPIPMFGKGVKVALDGIRLNSYCRDTAGPCDPRVTTLLEIAAAFGYPSLLADSWAGNDPCQHWSFIVCAPGGKIITVNLQKQNLTGTISPAFANLTDLWKLTQW